MRWILKVLPALRALAFTLIAVIAGASVTVSAKLQKFEDRIDEVLHTERWLGTLAERNQQAEQEMKRGEQRMREPQPR